MSEILFQNEKYKETEGVTQYQSPSQHMQGPRFDSPTLWRKMLFVVVALWSSQAAEAGRSLWLQGQPGLIVSFRPPRAVYQDFGKTHTYKQTY